MKKTTKALLLLLLLVATDSSWAYAQERPVLTPLPRYDEDWSFLRDEQKRTGPFDSIKYVPLSSLNSEAYISFGGDIRIRQESFFNGSVVGITPKDEDHYTYLRGLLHADMHLSESVRSFLQLGYSNVFSKEGVITPTEKNDLDIAQFFIEPKFKFTEDLSASFRLGRQEILLGSQRLIGVRDGPNIRQGFDGARITFSQKNTKVNLLAARSVKTNEEKIDKADNGQSLWGIYGVIPINKFLNSDLYFLAYEREDARFAQGLRDEDRKNIGTRLWGKNGNWDYDFEGLYQYGSFGAGHISAWTLASDTGYRFTGTTWTPRLALKANVASGDDNIADKDLQTFNALYPRGAYFTENGIIGPSNFINLHPYIQIAPLKSVTLETGAVLLWRHNKSDAVYRQPNIPINGTAGHDDRYIGTQGYVLANWRLNPHITLSGTYVHFDIGDALKDAGGENSDYIGSWVTFRF